MGLETISGGSDRIVGVWGVLKLSFRVESEEQWNQNQIKTPTAKSASA